MITNNTILQSVKRGRGFTLVELIGILTVIAIICTISLSPMLALIQRARIRAEQETCAKLREEIKASFRHDSMYNNISAIAEELPFVAEQRTTVFDNAEVVGVSDYSWYMKLARLRGQDVSAVAMLPGTPLGRQPNAAGEVINIGLNAFGRQRLLILGPTPSQSGVVSENMPQRYLLLSFLFLEDATAPRLSWSIPAGSTYEDWFNSLYNFDWGKGDGAPVGQDARWGNTTSGRGLAFAQRVVVERIVQPRYVVTVNNLSSDVPGASPGDPPAIYADAVYVYSNMEGVSRETATLVSYHERGFSIFPLTVPFRIFGLLEGRRVIITRGRTKKADGSLEEEINYTAVLSVLMNENITYTAQ